MSNNEVYEMLRFAYGRKYAGQLTAAIDDRGWYRPLAVADVLIQSPDEFQDLLREVRSINQANRDNFPIRRRRGKRRPRTAKVC